MEFYINPLIAGILIPFASMNLNYVALNGKSIPAIRLKRLLLNISANPFFIPTNVLFARNIIGHFIAIINLPC